MKSLVVLPPTSAMAVRPSGRVWTANLIGVKMALVLGLCAGLLWLASAAPAFASTISLSDGNSEVAIDPYSQAGVSNWTVDNVDQLYQQWFWYRIGSSGPESSIDTLGTPTITQYSADYATVTYAGSNGVTIKVGYTLSGGGPGSGTSDLAENIKITNTSQSAQTVHFFEYSNFVLLGSDTPNGDYVQFQNNSSVNQWKAGSSESLSETVISPVPNHREAASYPTTLNELNGISGYQLSDLNSNSPSTVLGPGDMTWAYEWDTTMLPGGTFLISKDKQLSGVTPAPSVPEPSTWAWCWWPVYSRLLGSPIGERRGERQ